MSSPEIDSPELGAVEVHGMTRSSFILRGAITAGAVIRRRRGRPVSSATRSPPAAVAISTS